MTIAMFDWICQKPTEQFWDTRCTPEERLRQQRLIEAIREAVTQLSGIDRRIIERHYFEGRTYAEIGKELRILPGRVKTRSRRSRRRLRKLLAVIVRTQFHIKLLQADCPICNSRSRAEAEAIIAGRRPRGSFAPVLRSLKKELAIVVKSPNTIIGHTKYHC